MINVMIVGQKWLAEQLLQQCIDTTNVNVVAVSPPKLDDKLAVLAHQHNITVIVHDKQLSDSQIPSGVDVILTAHAYCFVSAKARAKVSYGAIGYHPSLLPLYKGKDAIIDCLSNGDEVTGGSLYQLDDGWDTGKVLLQHSITIDHDETAMDLWKVKLAPLGLELFKKYLETLV